MSAAALVRGTPPSSPPAASRCADVTKLRELLGVASGSLKYGMLAGGMVDGTVKVFDPAKMMLPDPGGGGESPLLANLEAPNKRYNTQRVSPEPLHMCPDDGYVCFQDSELLCGVMDKAWLGDGQKNGLFAILLRDAGCAAAARG